MVYNALMTAMLSGDFASGALFMAAFGLATVPAVAAVAAGAGFMARRGTSRAGLFRPAAGSTLVALGVLSALFPQAFLSGLCLT
jgi:sulfite exporter TauE/SafE